MISLYENGLNGILADEMGLGKVRLSFEAWLHAEGIDIADDIFPGSFEIKGNMGTFPYRLSTLRAQQLGDGVREIRSDDPCKLSRTLDNQ